MVERMRCARCLCPVSLALLPILIELLLSRQMLYLFLLLLLLLLLVRALLQARAQLMHSPRCAQDRPQSDKG